MEMRQSSFNMDIFFLGIDFLSFCDCSTIPSDFFALPSFPTDFDVPSLQPNRMTLLKSPNNPFFYRTVRCTYILMIFDRWFLENSGFYRWISQYCLTKLICSKRIEIKSVDSVCSAARFKTVNAYKRLECFTRCIALQCLHAHSNIHIRQLIIGIACRMCRVKSMTCFVFSITFMCANFNPECAIVCLRGMWILVSSRFDNIN